MTWFRRLGWFHFPVSPAGILITVGAFGFCVQVFIAVDRRSHSVSDTLYGIYPFVIPTLLVLDWIATRTSVSAPRA